jgi:hypothetical protein
MDPLDRGALRRLDRTLLASFGQDERFQMVRVSVTPANWSTWKRYCGAAGIAMGRAIAALVDRELLVVFVAADVDGSPILAQQADERLRDREVEFADRQRDLDTAQERLRRCSEHLRRWESMSRSATGPATPCAKVGRNERCPCGSGFKYKLCHGLVAEGRA